MSTSIGFNLRPVKIAYFVDDSDLDAYTEIAHFCCTQWGGINNFIIPVANNGVWPYFAAVLRAHKLDRAVSACTIHATRLDEFHTSHMRDVSVHDWTLYKRHDEVLHPLAVYRPAMLSVAEAEHLKVYSYSALDRLDPLERACIMAAFGQIWPGQEDDYWSMFQPEHMELTGNDEGYLKQQLAREPLASPINFTGMHVSAQFSRNMPDKLWIDVVVPNNVIDLCLFWNLRAIENVGIRSGLDAVRRVMVIPPSLFVQARFRRLLFETIRPTLISPFRSSSLDVDVLTSGSATAKRRIWSALQRTEQSGLIQPISDRASSTRHWGRPRDDFGRDRHARGEPLIYMFNALPSLPKEYRETADSVTLRGVELHEGENELYTPPRSITFGGAGEIMLDVQSDYWARYPFHSSVADKISQNATFTDYGLSRHVISGNGETLHSLNVLSEQQALDAFFLAAGYRVQRGTIYLQAQTLITLMGGIEECQFLCRREVLQILERLAVKTTNKLSQDIARHVLGQSHLRAVTDQERDELIEVVRQALAQADIAAAIQRASTSVEALRAVPELRRAWGDIVPILDHLVRHQIVFRGFNVKCVKCGTPTWHALNTAQEIVQCPGCFDRFPLSVMVEGGRERPWEYTLNTSINRAIDQDVLTPVLLLTKLAKERDPIYCQTIGLKLGTAANPDIGDFDVVFVKEQRLYAGECKTGSELKEKDIRMAELALEIGCSGFLFASRSAFTKDSRLLIDEFKAKIADSHKSFEVTVYEENDLLVQPQ